MQMPKIFTFCKHFVAFWISAYHRQALHRYCSLLQSRYNFSQDVHSSLDLVDHSAPACRLRTSTSFVGWYPNCSEFQSRLDQGKGQVRKASTSYGLSSRCATRSCEVPAGEIPWSHPCRGRQRRATPPSRLQVQCQVLPCNQVPGEELSRVRSSQRREWNAPFASRLLQQRRLCQGGGILSREISWLGEGQGSLRAASTPSRLLEQGPCQSRAVLGPQISGSGHYRGQGWR